MGLAGDQDSPAVAEEPAGLRESTDLLTAVSMRGLGMQDGPHGGRLPPRVLEPKSEIGCEPGYQRPPREPPRPPPPPKPPRPPPPPPRRSPPPPAPGAFAFSTWMVRPSRLVPLRRVKARSASSRVPLSADPRARRPPGFPVV